MFVKGFPGWVVAIVFIGDIIWSTVAFIGDHTTAGSMILGMGILSLVAFAIFGPHSNTAEEEKIITQELVQKIIDIENIENIANIENTKITNEELEIVSKLIKGENNE